MNLVEWAVLIGFGVPIMSLCILIAAFACAMQRREVAKNG
jgi:hypothetical protein